MQEARWRYIQAAFLSKLPDKGGLRRLTVLHGPAWKLQNVAARNLLSGNQNLAAAQKHAVNT